MKAAISMGDDELRRKDHIITALTERISELESPRATREEPASRPRRHLPLVAHRPIDLYRSMYPMPSITGLSVGSSTTSKLTAAFSPSSSLSYLNNLPP
jgi:hypothetical protein